MTLDERLALLLNAAGRQEKTMSAEKMPKAAPVDRIVMPPPGMRWIYQRTQVSVMIVKVNPKRGWPHHTLRAIFQDGKSAFTFHCEMIGFYFRQVPVEA